MSALVARLSRLAALALALVVAVAIVGLGVLPMLGYAERLEQDIALTSELADRLSSQVRGGEHYADQVAALTEELAASEHHFRAETDALAAAEIQRRFLDAASGSGLTVVSVQSLPTVTEDDLVRVGIRADTTGPVEALSALLYRLEAASPYVFLDNLVVQAGAAAAPAGDSPAVPLFARLDIAGYMAPEPAR